MGWGDSFRVFRTSSCFLERCPRNHKKGVRVQGAPPPRLFTGIADNVRPFVVLVTP